MTEADIAKGEALLRALKLASLKYFGASDDDGERDVARQALSDARIAWELWSGLSGCASALLQAARESQRLREALRAHAIVNETDNARGRRCLVCGRRWPRSASEKHAPGCLAALTPDGGRNDQER